MKTHIKLVLVLASTVLLGACDSSSSSDPEQDPGTDPTPTPSAATLSAVANAGPMDDAVALDVTALQSNLDALTAGGRNAEPTPIEAGETVVSIIARIAQ